MAEKNNPQKLHDLRHSAAHLLAHAVQELHPNTLLTIGPVTDDGFFYDFLPETHFKNEDLPKIEAKMREIAERNLPITQQEVSKEQARELFKNNPFKLELIDAIEGDTVGISRQGDFYDLCRGGHVASTGHIKHFKLLAISGSYWRADRDNQALQRITGTAFLNAKDMRLYEKRLVEAKKYDHRRLGKELDLFSFNEYGPGFVFFHPHGDTIVRLLKGFLRSKLENAGYSEISTPIMLSDELWKQSGHFAHYKEHMYLSTVDEKQYAIRPMNCPGSVLVYKTRPRSYRELPYKLSEFGVVHRYELSGVMHGLFRCRAFTIDDAHIYCTPEQIEDEVLETVHMVFDVMKTFGFETISVGIATRPDNAMGDPELWETATDALKHALERANISYDIFEGEGAFYGPKIEFRVQDSMGREWQCSTVQVDFFMPKNFDLTYVAPSGQHERPVMVHRAIYGSIERFLGILLEHYKGKLPFWLAPVQAKVLTITDEQNEYAHTIYTQLKDAGIRVDIDESSDPIAGQIKAAQQQQIPWMVVIGPKEAENKTVTLRYRDGKQAFGITLSELLEKATTANTP